MKIYKSIIAGTLLFLAAAFPLRSSAADEEYQQFRSLTVTTVNGKLFGINLANMMEGIFNNSGEFVVQTLEYNDDGSWKVDEDGNRVTTTYLTIPGTELKSVAFSKEPSGVAAPGAEKEFDMAYDVRTSMLRVTGAQGKSISIFSVDSRLEFNAEAEAETVIDMSRFGAGVHIVKIDKTTFKLLVK